MMVVESRDKMRRGFTLIELLAVIVILAIIALIATPIVLNIINDTKESATLRSAEFYLDAVEQAIVRAQLKGESISSGNYEILENGNICLEEYDNVTKECKDKDGITNNNELIVKVKGETPSSGSIYIESGSINNASINLNDKNIIQNSNGELIYNPCTLVKYNDEEGITPGDEYICEVKPGTKYTFFVLSKEEDGSTNLIMNRNINSDGTPVTKAITEENAENGVYNLVAWAPSSYPADGPVIAMNYLYKATKDWINVPNIIMNYEDENIDYEKLEKGNQYGYGGIRTENNITKITSSNGTVLKVLDDKDGYTNLKARLPKFNEVYDPENCTFSVGTCPLYLVNYLQSSDYYASEEGKENINEIEGYWTLASSSDNTNIYVYTVEYRGFVGGYDCDHSWRFGVRPVINIKL